MTQRIPSAGEWARRVGHGVVRIERVFECNGRMRVEFRRGPASSGICELSELELVPLATSNPRPRIRAVPFEGANHHQDLLKHWKKATAHA